MRGARATTMTYSGPPRRRIGPLVKGLLLAGTAVGVPALASAVIRRRVEPPASPRWGRAHRYAGRHGEIVFQELGAHRGDRPPLVLLHSFGPGHDSNEWRAAAERLAEAYRVYAPDLPGWGRSAPPPAGSWRPSFYVDALEGFLGGVVREPAVVVASGLPAAYAARLAAEHPGRLRGLALVSPLGLEAHGDTFLGRLLRIPVLRDTVLDLLTSRSAITHHLRKEVYAAPERVDAALLDHHYRASHLPRSRSALAAYMGGDLRDGVAEILPEIGIPVWLAWGRRSSVPPATDADRWLSRLPHTAELEVFETAGALPHAEAPAAFCGALDRFVAGISGR